MTCFSMSSFLFLSFICLDNTTLTSLCSCLSLFESAFFFEFLSHAPLFGVSLDLLFFSLGFLFELRVDFGGHFVYEFLGFFFELLRSVGFFVLLNVELAHDFLLDLDFFFTFFLSSHSGKELGILVFRPHVLHLPAPLVFLFEGGHLLEFEFFLELGDHEGFLGFLSVDFALSDGGVHDHLTISAFFVSGDPLSDLFDPELFFALGFSEEFLLHFFVVTLGLAFLSLAFFLLADLFVKFLFHEFLLIFAGEHLLVLLLEVEQSVEVLDFSPLV
mmetsp:Transcript_7285/g.6809  ORF Transcript_7285/g.6809 Transcript_7285/m.6809 type:complete len:273 (+) Transcript_7285:271-1089(+)